MHGGAGEKTRRSFRLDDICFGNGTKAYDKGALIRNTTGEGSERKMQEEPKWRYIGCYGNPKCGVQLKAETDCVQYRYGASRKKIKIGFTIKIMACVRNLSMHYVAARSSLCI